MPPLPPDLIVVLASMVVLCVGSKGQVFATSAIRYTWATSRPSWGCKSLGSVLGVVQVGAHTELGCLLGDPARARPGLGL